MTLSGQTIGSYTVLLPVGRGVTGEVYRATDLRTGQSVAIKQLHHDLVIADPEALPRFQREAEMLRDLDHPNVVSLLALLEHNGDFYLVMEYVPGGTLRDRLEAHPDGLAQDEALAISLELADALTRAHHLGVIHRDLKPENVLLADDGTPRLSDFGLARFQDRTTLTQSGTVLGTLAYMSPEAFQGLPLDERADIWSFGVLLYELLTGERPFTGSDPPSLMHAVFHDPLPDLSSSHPQFPDTLIDLLYRTLEKDREARIPSMRLVGAQIETIQQGRVSLFAAPTPDLTQPRRSLPRHATPFIGRQAQLEELEALLTLPDAPLVTILGPGGMGKTRLAIELARRCEERFADGAAFVSLAELMDPSVIPSAMAAALDYQLSVGDPQAQVLDYLAPRDLLLVLDNFEHLLEGAAFITEVLDRAPGVQLLVTSRARLPLHAEVAYELSGMLAPESDGDVVFETVEAVELFLTYARRISPGFALDTADKAAVWRICRLVTGVPLALELAAAWLRMLSPAEIVEELASDLDFLTSEMSDLPERQRSMRAAFDHSWWLLDEAERTALMRMSVFRGGASRRAAQTITGASLRTLAALADKSLLWRISETGRFTVHELIRQFAQEALDDKGEAEALRNAHSAYYLSALAEREPDLKGRDQVRALNDIASDFENVRAAWLWAVEQRDFEAVGRAAFSLDFFCQVRRSNERVPLLQVAADGLETETGEAPQLAWIQMNPLYIVARCAAGLLEDSVAYLKQHLEIVRQYGDQSNEALALLTLGRMLNFHEGEKSSAIPFLEYAERLFEQLGDAYRQAEALHSLGSCYVYADTERFRAYTQRAFELRQSIGDKLGMAASLNGLVFYEAYCGNRDIKYSYVQQEYHLYQELGDRSGLAWTLANSLVGWEITVTHDLAKARELAEEAARLAENVGFAQEKRAVEFALGELMLAQGEYQQARRHLQVVQSMIKGATQAHEVHWNLAHAALGLGELEAAWNHLRSGSQVTVGSTRYTGLGLLGVYIAKEGQFERAVELLGLYYAMPQLAYGPDDDPYPLFQETFSMLRDELPSHIFEEARLRGQALNVDEEFEREYGEYLSGSDG